MEILTTPKKMDDTGCDTFAGSEKWPGRAFTQFPSSTSSSPRRLHDHDDTSQQSASPQLSAYPILQARAQEGGHPMARSTTPAAAPRGHAYIVVDGGSRPVSKNYFLHSSGAAAERCGPAGAVQRLWACTDVQQACFAIDE
jgi:hypothetical protein